VFGTSTGAIIAALVALGLEVDEIHKLYKEHVPNVMKFWWPSKKSRALADLAQEVFGEKIFEDVKTHIGIVTTKWVTEQPMIFKTSPEQAHGGAGTFIPGFGVPIAEAVQASCSAYPFFQRKTVVTSVGDTEYELADGGFCANNPTLYAIADAVKAMKQPHSALRVISVGVGVYPPPKRNLFLRYLCMLPSIKLLQKTLEINTQSMEQLRSVLFKDINTVRISDSFPEPEMATDLMEHDLKKLNLLYARGRDSFRNNETALRECLLSKA